MDPEKYESIGEMMRKKHPKWLRQSKKHGREEYVYTKKDSPLSENWVNEVFSEQERRYIVATDMKKKDGYTMRIPRDIRYNNFNLYSISAYENAYEERYYPAEYSYHVWMQEIANTKNDFTFTDGADATLLSYDGDDSNVIIPAGIKIIGAKAFDECLSLKKVKIPTGVTSIGERAFINCSNLKSIKIPDSVTSIGDEAFKQCKNLENVYITDISKWCEISFGRWRGSPFDRAKKLYLNYTLVTDLMIPDGVTSINDYAFYGCGGLTSVTIPGSVTTIGKCAFGDCSSLKSVTIPSSVTHIGEHAFMNCSVLTRVTIPDSVISIGEDAFKDTGYYNNEANWEDNLLYMGNCLIASKEKTDGDYYIRNGTRVIANGVFRDFSSITSVTIPDSVISIGGDAFNGCENLKNVYITDISKWCGIKFDGWRGNPFSYAKNLYLNNKLVTDLIIPDGVTSINDYAFYGCSGLKSVTIPDSVTSIGDCAFESCSGLTCLTIPESVTSIGSRAFYGCTDLTSMTIPDGVTSIGEGTFSGCGSLKSVTIPDSVTYIGSNAFEFCSSLKSVTIPDGVKTVSDKAFQFCSSLKSVTIPDSITFIASYAFDGCNLINTINVGSNEIKNCILNGIEYKKQKTE